MTEFEKGYQKAIKDIKAKFSEVQSNNYTDRFVQEVFKQVTAERKEEIKPVIYFTKLNKKGDLEFDEEKTKYFAENPEELNDYFKKNPPQPAPRVVENVKSPKLTTIDSKDPTFGKIMKDLVGGKTIEMCKGENSLSIGDIGDYDDVDVFYLNALIQQVSYLAANPITMQAMLDACCIDKEADNVVKLLLDYMTSGNWLFKFKK